LEASKACHLHPGAAYFIQYTIGDSPTIRATHAFGDTDAQITCMLQRLPGDFIARFAVEIDNSPPATRQGRSGRRTTRARKIP